MYVVVMLKNVDQRCRFPACGFPAGHSSFTYHEYGARFSTLMDEGAMSSGHAELHVELNSEYLTSLQGFAESLQHCIRPQSSATSLYGRFGAQCLPYKKLLSSEV